jgi:hypothetical protein
MREAVSREERKEGEDGGSSVEDGKGRTEIGSWEPRTLLRWFWGYWGEGTCVRPTKADPPSPGYGATGWLAGPPHHFGFKKSFDFLANTQICDGWPMGHYSQIPDFESLAKAFLIFGVGGPSHSEKMKINGKNLRVTFPTRIQLFETCDLMGG